MAEQIFSGLMVATAIALLARLALGERGRARVAESWRRATRRFERRPTPPPRPMDARDAARLAEDAIRRARDRSAVRDGNVIRPTAFGRERGRGGDDGTGTDGKGRRDRNLH